MREYYCGTCGFRTLSLRERNVHARQNPKHSIGMVKKRRVVPSVLTPGELVRAGWPLPAKT